MDKIYERALKYGIITPVSDLTEKVRAEDERRFRAEMVQIPFQCPECRKSHSLNEEVLSSLVETGIRQGALGRTGITSHCPENEALIDLEINCRTNNYSTPFYDIKAQNIKIKARSLNRLVFEQKDLRSLTIEQLKKIVAFHRQRRATHSEAMISKALKELRVRELEAPPFQVNGLATNPEIEDVETVENPKKKGVLTRFVNKLK